MIKERKTRDRGSMSSSKERSTLTGTRSGGVLRSHSRFLQDVDELAAKRADVLLDLVHVVLGHTFVLGLALLHRHVATHQILHYSPIPVVALRGLFHLSLRNNNEYILIWTGSCLGYEQ